MELLTLLTLADAIDEAVKDTDVDIRLSNTEKVLTKVRNSVLSLGYAYDFAVESVSVIIKMQKDEQCRNKLMFNEDIEYAKRISSICRYVVNKESIA